MLNYNERMNVIFNDAKILSARHHDEILGLGKNQKPTTEAEQQRVNRLKGLLTYSEIKATGTRTPYKAYVLQF